MVGAIESVKGAGTIRRRCIAPQPLPVRAVVARALGKTPAARPQR